MREPPVGLAPLLLVVGLLAFAAAEGVAEEVFDVGVEGAELLGGPGAQLGHEVGREAQEERFALRRLLIVFAIRRFGHDRSLVSCRESRC